jgi:AraC-like DNA-binding protein
VAYRELKPPPELESHVACLWASTGGPSGRVLPDGCVDIVWNGEDLVVAGPSTEAFVPRVAPTATALGLRFRVGAAGPALGLPARELLNASPRLADVWRDGGELTERLGSAGTDPLRADALVAAVARRLRDAERVDPVVRGAALGAGGPDARVADLADGLGERQLRRRFDAAVGYGPKTLVRVLRLQRFLALARAGGSPGIARLALDAGYADQPHLTRECARLTGATPAELLAAGAAPAGDRSLSAS